MPVSKTGWTKPPRNWLCVLVVISVLVTTLLGGCSWFNNRFGQGTPQDPLAITPGSPEAKLAAEAQGLYTEAWHMVLEEYVDGDFNGQDWYRWKDRYKNRLRDLDDAHVAIKTMLASLGDDYTRFLPPREMREQTINIDSKLSGIGVQIIKRKNRLVVVGVIEGTPAQEVGLKAGDKITHIDGTDVSDLSIEACADIIRGELGTSVKLAILRGEEQPQTFTKNVTRAEIKIKSVYTKDLKDKRIGYVRLTSFIGENAIHELSAKLDAMPDKQALVIDLRGNYGGLLSNAVEMANLFLDKGAIVSIVDRDDDARVYRAKPGQVTRKPLVVLIDGGSASASEILSGALKDHHRATLVGTQTYGKGLVQKINPLSDGSGLNITISKYLTPNGTDINKKGIDPDVEVHYTEADYHADRDPQLDKAIEVLQAKIEMNNKALAAH